MRRGTEGLIAVPRLASPGCETRTHPWDRSWPKRLTKAAGFTKGIARLGSD